MTNKMKPEIKKLWVEALRSGDYEQGVGRLHEWNQDGDEMFCCLGVLCDLAIQNGVNIPVVDWCYEESDWAAGINADLAGSYIYGDEVECLPDAVIEWSGIHDKTGSIAEMRTSLTDLNDSGMPFQQISTLIEVYL